MKRFVGVAALVVSLAVLPAGTASAYLGAPNLHIFELPASFVKADGPGFDVKLTRNGLGVEINDEKFGIPEAGFPIERVTQNFGPNPTGARSSATTARTGSCRRRSTSRTRASQPPEVDRPAPYSAAVQHRLPEHLHVRRHLRGAPSRTRPASSSRSTCRISRTRSWATTCSPRRTRSTRTSSIPGARIRDRASLVGRVNIDTKSGVGPALDPRSRAPATRRRT